MTIRIVRYAPTWPSSLTLRSLALGLLLPGLLACTGSILGAGLDGDGDGDGGPSGGADATPAPAPGPGETVFALDTLHEVTLTVEPQYLDQLENDRENRVPCTISYDGIVVANAGIRQKGGIGSVSNLAEKPGFSIKLDETVNGQKLDGLKKLLLNNAIQDPSFLNEHVGYELYRRAGIPAPRTAHAVVSLNGFTYGIYVVAEAVDGDFLARELDGRNDGNLYEGPCCADFVDDPDGVELKDELEDMRSRADLESFAQLVRDTPDQQLEAAVNARLDLEGMIRGFAIDSIVDHWDGYAHNTNNYYLYNDPGDGRFLMMPHGMDQLFQDPNRDVLGGAKGRLAQRVRQVPALDARYTAAIAWVLANAWDVAALQARLDRAAAVVRSSTHTDERMLGDLRSFDDTFDAARSIIATRKAQLSAP